MKDHELSGGEVYTDDLTWREQEVLILLAKRLTNREIADQLHLAESTVKDHVGKILSKLYVKNRRQAVERAGDLGLLDNGQMQVLTQPSNLPSEATPFVGRRGELAEIKQLLLETRLLTLTGPGGMGKTRLALKATVETAGEFEDGCFFVSLAPIGSSEHIIQTIAEAVNFPLATHEDPQHQLLRYLRKKQLLLILDNFEHLLDGVGIVSEILLTTPKVKILVTSRERLNLQSETILNVYGMDFPDQVGLVGSLNYDAITLFVQSAKKIRPGYDPIPDDLVEIVHICQIVEGMPLAIELAAAWLHILNVNEIAEELTKDMDILTTEVRDAPQRHRSIRAVFDHSWSLLDHTEQGIFVRLSVFRGGFTREAAQQVSGASLQELAGLVDKSFLNHDPDSGRLEVHELLRQYAQERLEERPEASLSAQDAHAAFFAEFMQQRGDRLKGSGQMQALTEINDDIENVRAAWQYYLEQKNIPQMWKFIYGLWHFYWIRWWNHAGMELFAEAARELQHEQDGEAVAFRALAVAYQGYFMGWLGLAEQGYELAQESVEILQQLNHPMALAFAYDSMGVNAYFLKLYKEEIKAADKMLKVATDIGDKWLLAFTLFAVSMGALLKEDYTKASRLAESNLKLNVEIGDSIGSTMSLIVLGHAALACGEIERARGFYLRCLKTSQETDFYYGIQTASKYLGKLAITMREIPKAEKYLLQCLDISFEILFIRDIINLFYEFARLRAAQENPEGAVELLALVIQHPASNESRLLEGRIRDSAKDLLSKLEDELPQEIFTAALKRGQELELDGVIEDLVGSKR